MKIVTWNIQWGLGLDGVVDPARLVRHARALGDFDILCLQEVSDNFPNLKGNDGADQFAALADLLPGFTPIAGPVLDIPDAAGRRKRFGNMMLSRLPVGLILRWLLPWEADATPNMPRLLIEAVVEAPFGPVRVMTTHLEYSSDKLRGAQVDSIREAHRQACAREALQREDGTGTYVRTPGTRSAILTGDFNMRPGDPTLARIGAPIADGVPAFADAWTHLNGSAPHPFSFCLHEQLYGPPHCSDYVFVTQDLRPRLRSIHYDLDTRLSDHQPIIVELDD